MTATNVPLTNEEVYHWVDACLAGTASHAQVSHIEWGPGGRVPDDHIRIHYFLHDEHGRSYIDEMTGDVAKTEVVVPFLCPMSQQTV